MFTIEHDFDATIITLVDEGAARPEALREDVIITAFEDCVTLRQLDSLNGDEVVITLSLSQLANWPQRSTCPKAATGWSSPKSAAKPLQHGAFDIPPPYPAG
jgi:hypothetical protein